MNYNFKTAVGIVLNGQGQVLLGRCVTDDDRDGLLCFPGGGIDDGEDIFSAAMREVKEETNATTVLEQMVFHVHNTKNFVAYVVLQDSGKNDTLIFNDEYDQSDPGGWYSLDSLPTSEVFNQNLDVLQVLNLIPKYNVEYKTNNENMDIKKLIESGATVEDILSEKKVYYATSNGKSYDQKDATSMADYYERTGEWAKGLAQKEFKGLMKYFKIKLSDDGSSGKPEKDPAGGYGRNSHK